MFFKENISNRQIDKLYENLKYSQPSIVILAVFITYIYYFLENEKNIIYWFFLYIFITALRFLDYIFFLKDKDYKKHFKIFLLLTSISGLLFSSIFLIFEPHHNITKYFMIFIIAGISAGAISTLAYSKIAIIFYELSLITPVILHFLLKNDFVNQMMVLILLFYLIMILKISVNTYKFYLDISGLKDKISKKTDQLIIQNQRFFHLFRNIPLGIFFYDKDLKITDCNTFFAKNLSLSKNRLIGFNINNIKDRRILPALKNVFNKKNGYYKGEYITTFSNERYFIELFTSFVELNNEVIEGVGVVIDLTELKKSQKKIEKLAFYDELTGLPKRMKLLESIDYAIKKVKREKIYSSLIYLDIDNFKDINDSLGHNVGDLFLKEIAKRLTECIRDIDIASRLGGDEFAVLLMDISNNKEVAIKNSIEVADRILENIKKTIYINGYEIKTSASVGIVLIDENINDAFEAIKFADSAMYNIKKASKNNISIYNEELSRKIERLYEIKSDLEVAIKESQFVLYLQPQVDTKQNIIGAEALIRWIHPKKGLIQPYQFLDVAQEFNFIPKITDIVLKEAKNILKILPKNIKLAINISGNDIYENIFIDNLKIFSKDEGKLLEFELTEQILIKDVEKAIEIINKINSLYNIKFSIDDFGTGYSSLQYLKKLPVKNLKIDKSFIKDMLTNKNDYIIVQTIVNMAKNLNIKVVAEGVETQKHFEALKKMGVDYFQGYYFGKPMEVKEFIKLLS